MSRLPGQQAHSVSGLAAGFISYRCFVAARVQQLECLPKLGLPRRGGAASGAAVDGAGGAWRRRLCARAGGSDQRLACSEPDT